MLIVSYFDKYVTFFILRGMEERTFANLVSMHFLFNLLSFGKYQVCIFSPENLIFGVWGVDVGKYKIYPIHAR